VDDVTRTHTVTQMASGAAPRKVLCLSIVHHVDPAYLGRRAPLKSGAPLALGRDCPLFGATSLGDSRISREHALVQISNAGKITIEDRGSRNGTWVNEKRTENETLQHGDVFRLGSTLFLVHESEASPPPLQDKALIGISASIRHMLDEIQKVAAHRTTVLILGETGTGKEVVARLLHASSKRNAGSFHAVNCGGMSDTLLQSELFGHVRGAFSGADRDRVGLLESASGGTLFLDEIGDASPALQVALLRALQDGEIRRIGSNRTIQVDTRVLAATHQDVDQLVQSGGFREDLLARLSGWVIQVPPLRDRPEDIPLLTQHFLSEHVQPAPALHHRVSFALVRYRWPRNVRELETVVERAWIESDGEEVISLTPALSELLTRTVDDTPTSPGMSKESNPKRFRNKQALEELLTRHGGNVRNVAQEAGVARNTLYRWFQSFDIDPEAWRQ